MLRRALLTGAAVFFVGASSALAADIIYVPPPVVFPPPPPPMTVQAHVDLYAGFATVDDNQQQQICIGECTDTSFLFGGAGRANVPLQNNWNLQLDAQGRARVFSYGKGGSYSYPEFGGYGHLYYRDPASHALGIFGGANFLGPQVYTIGVEGQMYWPQFTLYGQASVNSIRAYGDTATAVQLRGEGQWYATDDMVLLGDLIWTHLSYSGETANILTLAGTAMHRFNGGPFSGFIKGQWDHYTYDDYDYRADQFSAVLGVRVQADPPGSTIKSHRRLGPAMDVEPIPTFGECFADCIR